MIHILLQVVAVLLMVALVVGRLIALQHVGTCPLIFGGCEAILLHPLRLAHQGSQGRIDGLLFGNGRHRPGSLRTSHEEVSLKGSCIHKGWIGLLDQFVEPFAHHGRGHRLDVVLDQSGYGSAQLPRHLLVFVEDIEHRTGRFLVGRDGDQRLHIVRYQLLFPFGRIHRSRNVGKDLFQPLFQLIHIDVAHDNDRLQIRTIPFLVIGPQLVGLKSFNHLNVTNRHPVGIPASRHDLR